MKNFIINLLFKLLGNNSSRLNSIQYLFGSPITFADRKKRWENALIRVWKDKDFLDWLYYQAEGDKERAWQGKIDRKLAQGARVRTLFIVYQARRAYEERVRVRAEGAQEASEQVSEIKNINSVYKSLVDIE